MFPLCTLQTYSTFHHLRNPAKTNLLTDGFPCPVQGEAAFAHFVFDITFGLNTGPSLSPAPEMEREEKREKSANFFVYLFITLFYCNIFYAS